MKLVKCITERTSIPEQIIVDKKYWIDETTEYKDCDGDEYAEVYLDEAKKHRVGMIQTKHFETVYRYLNYGESLSNYINSHTGFLLKDIISWCLSNPTSSLANNLIMYIHDNKLDAEENMEKEELSQKNKAFLDKREELSKNINELKMECFRLSGRKEKLTESIDNYTNYMWEQYELTYHSALSLKTQTELTIPGMKAKISEIKKQIKSLGSVNVNAVEQYKEVSERYELLTTQHDDLIEAAKVLEKIIEELDIEMRKQFEEQFSEIRNRFDKVFKELFGGGRGTLELMEDEDILTAGIKIIAQPPGKKLQNMMQLSGGEKALTAIALLFAIQSLKPSPFCLLDEIEAALDDSNVGRYADYLHKLTKDTQFIVITHRRGTMNAADILYGITMQEKGVSTLVSVSLLDEKDIAN